MIRWAVVAPTLPAPMTVTLRRGVWCISCSSGFAAWVGRPGAARLTLRRL